MKTECKTRTSIRDLFGTSEKSRTRFRRLGSESLEERRLLAVGDLDLSFGTDGTVLTHLGWNSGASDMVQQDDGKLVVSSADRGPSGNDVNMAVVRYNADGSLDTTFGGGDGIFTHDLGSDNDYTKDVTIDSQGRILVLGGTYPGNNISNADVAVLRLTSSGTLDPTFGNGGVSIINFGGRDDGRGIALDSVGRIVVVGATQQNVWDFTVARLTENGQLDTSFDGDGKVVFGFGGDDRGESVAIDSQDRIVVAGRSDFDFAVARLSSSGQLDTSFDGDGKRKIDFGGSDSANDLAIDGDDRVLLGGSGDGKLAVARVTETGQLDTTFDSDGFQTVDFGSSNQIGQGLALDASSNVVIAGYIGQGAQTNFAVARLTDTGELDLTFHNDGRQTVDFGNTNDFASSVLVDSSGRIVLAGGSVQVGSGSDVALTRLVGNSSPDITVEADDSATASVREADGGISVGDTQDVVFWNKMESLDGGNIDAEIGPDLNLSGPNWNFEPAQFGDGWDNNSKSSFAYANSADLIDDIREGAVEFWWAPDEAPQSGASARSVFISNGATNNPQSNKYGFELWYNYENKNTFTAFLDKRDGAGNSHSLLLGPNNNPVQGTWSPGDRVHVAFAWHNEPVIECQYIAALWVDGVLLRGWTEPDVGTLEGWSTTNPNTPFSPTTRIGDSIYPYSIDERLRGPIDNIVFWNYAKDDFSDRFHESPLHTLTVTDPDTTDTVDGSVESVIVTGDDGGIGNATLLAMLSVGPNPVIDGTSTTGSIDWSFDSGGVAFDHLAVGESLVLDYTVRATDSQGATDDQTVTITINGCNDAPEITIEAGDSVAETLIETDLGLWVTETLSVEDLDTIDTVNATVQSLTVTGDDDGLGNAALLAMMSVGANPVIDDTTTTGSINWTFDSGSEAFDHLAVGESLVLTYTLRATDSQSASDEQTVTVTINGTNDAPDILVEAGDSNTEALTETDAGLSVNSTLSVLDFDTTDTVAASIESVSVTGDDDGLGNAALLVMMSVGANPVIDETTTTGSINWTFDSGSEAFDHLAAGQTLTLAYTVRATDSQSAIDEQVVTITISGTNDVPDITTVGPGDSDAAVLTETDMGLTFSSTLSVLDVDVTDVVAASVESLTIAGDDGGIGNAALLAMMSLGANPVIDATTTIGTINWSFDSGSEAFDHLAFGETLALLYTVRATDNHSASDDQTVTVTIMGTNDAPVITTVVSDANCGSLGTANDPAHPVMVSGSFSDVDTSDTHTAIVNWGDGSPPQPVTVTENEPTQTGSFTGSHVYESSGTFSIMVIVDDGNGGTASEATTALVTGVDVRGGVLQIIGTDGKDKIDVKLKTQQGEDIYEVKADLDKGGPNKQKIDFEVNATAVDSIVMHLCDGDDDADIDKEVGVDAFVDAGAGEDKVKSGAGNDELIGGSGDDDLEGRDGDDQLFGDDGEDKLEGGEGSDDLFGGAGDDDLNAGAGENILSGGDGDDKLDAKQGKDVLIGGRGEDDLKGGDGGDLLIAALTTHDDDDETLQQIRSIWTSGLPYNQIVDDLTKPIADGGTGLLVPGVSVFDDQIEDKVDGKKDAEDLFFADIDGLHGDDDKLQGEEDDIVIDLGELLLTI